MDEQTDEKMPQEREEPAPGRAGDEHVAYVWSKDFTIRRTTI